MYLIVKSVWFGWDEEIYRKGKGRGRIRAESEELDVVVMDSEL